MHHKLVVILGQTASGKTGLGISLAKKFNGEVVSADSRQVYTGLDLGSGKVTQTEMNGIPHHLLDVANPKRKFTVAKFQKLANKKIKEIQKRGNIPFLVGGSGLYIQSVVDGIVLPEVKPNPALRKKLEQRTPAELYAILKKKDPKRAKNIDQHNPRRLIRALEIVLSTGKPVPTLSHSLPAQAGQESRSVIQIGIKKSPEEIEKAISKRLAKRLKLGMVKEVKNLRAKGLSWKRLEELGLEYRYIAQYLQGKVSYEEMVSKLQKEIEHFAKRQMTWFKRNQRIHWISNEKEAESLLRKHLLD